MTTITTTANETFTEDDNRALAFLVFRRFGRDPDAATVAWRRLLQNNATVAQFKKLLVDARVCPSCAAPASVTAESHRVFCMASWPPGPPSGPVHQYACPNCHAPGHIRLDGPTEERNARCTMCSWTGDSATAADEAEVLNGRAKGGV